MKKFDTRTIVTLGVLTAIEVVLSRFCSISAWNIKIGFNFVPICMAAVLFGPLGGGIVGALGDFVGAVLFPIGPYFPGLTLTAFLTGITFGLFLHRRQTVGRILGAVLVDQIALSLFLQTLWLSILYSTPYFELMATRVIQCVVLGPVQFIVIGALSKLIRMERRVVA